MWSTASWSLSAILLSGTNWISRNSEAGQDLMLAQQGHHVGRRFLECLDELLEGRLCHDRFAGCRKPKRCVSCPLSINHRRERESKAIGLGSHASVSSFRLRGSGCYSLAGVAVGDGLASAGVTYGLSIRIFKSSPPRITDQNPLICAGSEFWT